MDYIEYNNFYYGYDDFTKIFDIKPKKEYQIPRTFYKYYSLNEYSIESLSDLYIFATHPNLFNDPFDCNENLIKFSSWDVAKRFLLPILETDVEKLFPTLESANQFCKRAFKAILYKKLGLLSLSVRNDDYRMWSLYAKNNGFCIEFDVSKFPFPHFGPFPINYVNRINHPITIDEFGGERAMLVQANVKNSWWEQENEWRLYIPAPNGIDMAYYGDEIDMRRLNFGDEHNRKFRYPISAIKSVILGPRFFEGLCRNNISCVEKDIICTPKHNKLKYKILDFLAYFTEKSSLLVQRTSLEDFSQFDFIQILIMKYDNCKFRIIDVILLFSISSL